MPTDPSQYVTALTPNDVLFGRGSGPNDHEGNIKFRDMVASRKSEYLATNHRQTKAKIAKEIVDSVFACNGRFLKKLEPPEVQELGFDTRNDYYTLVDDDTIMEKAKQALRQNREKGSSTTQGSLSPKPNRQASNPLPINAFQSSPPTFAQGRSGNAQMPTDVFSAEPVPFGEDVHGYIDYITTLDDPEDAEDRGLGRRMSSLSRRSSLLGGRKDGIGPGRRDSLQMADVWKRDSGVQSMQMSDLMESLKGMSTTCDLHSSEETIGTIEGDILGKSQMSMSVMSMNSTTSLFKTNSSDKLVHNNVDTFPGPQNAIAWNSSVMQRLEMPPSGLTSQRSSMQSSLATGSISNLMLASFEGSSMALNFDSSPPNRQRKDSNAER